MGSLKLELDTDWNSDFIAFALQSGWKERMRVENYQAELISPKGRACHIPLDPGYSDFYDRGVAVLTDLAEELNLSVEEALVESRLTRSDVLEVSHPNSDPAGIPLSFGEQIVESFVSSFQMVTRSVSSQLPEYVKGERSANLKHLLLTDAKLGHTKKGSYVFRIVVPIVRPLIAEAAPATGSAQLSRAATLRFAHVCRQSKEAIGGEDIEDQVFLTAPVTAKLASIVDTAPATGEVKIAANFSRFIPLAESPQRLETRFTARDFEALATLARVLRRRESQLPSRLVGFVYSLYSFQKPGEEHKARIKVLLPDGRFRTFKLVLTPEQYQIALEAHRHVKYVSMQTPENLIGNTIRNPDEFYMLEAGLF